MRLSMGRVVLMRARPGRIKADICIELPHPRRYTVKATPVFSDYEAALTEEIRVESIKTVQWVSFRGCAAPQGAIARGSGFFRVFELRPAAISGRLAHPYCL